MSETFVPVNPSTGAPTEPIEQSSAATLDAAVDRAQESGRAWRALPFEERATLVEACGEALADNAQALARQMGQDMGKPVKHGAAEVASVRGRASSLVKTAREAVSEQVREAETLQVRVRWLPLGVVGVIGPWNYPVSTPNTLVMSALLTGNAVVFKPSEYAARTGALYTQIVREALGVHADVLGVAQGAGEVGRALVEHEGIGLIAFTGSIATGQAIMRSAAATLKRLVLELGGKDPMIVLADADLEAAAAHAVASGLHNSGQVCVAAERVFVDRRVHDVFVATVAKKMAALKVGDPMDEATDLGPMANAAQRTLVERQIAEATAGGAKHVVAGLRREPGFFLEPSLLTEVSSDMQIAREETFGPVIAISAFDDPARALAEANDTKYGLGASVWGAPGAELDALADGLEAGMVGVNRGLSAALGAPWVGWKCSGYGYTRSVEGMRQFLVPQSQSRPKQ